jgi:two-component system cell cycle sensor histidine kinase/response regulator CckA
MTNTSPPFPGSQDGEATEKSAPIDPPSAGVRILIMDDEPAVLEVATEFLLSVGYRVDAVVNGAEAMRAYQRAADAGDPYLLVMLDLFIDTGMGGQETLEMLRTINPQVTAIIVSGNAGDPLINSYAAHGFAASLLKPYRLEHLEEILARLLT